MTIQMNHVLGSSQIATMGYDAETKTLAVKFKSGGEYHYADVPPDKFEELKGAKSKGKFLHAKVKPFHPARKVE